MVAKLELGHEWVHVETGERIPEDSPELENIEDTDDWRYEKTCPECGESWVKVDMDSDEFVAAGWTTVHVPCASEETLRAAIDEEQRVIDILDQEREQ